MATRRNDHAYVQRRDALKRATIKNGWPCHLCLQPIAWDVDWKHPLAFTADHLDAVGTGGKMLGRLAPAH